MLPLEVVVIVVPAPKVTSSLYVCAPEVLTEAPLIAVVPQAFVVKLVRAEVLPTVPESIIVPVLLRVKEKRPFTVPPKVMSPEVFQEITVFAVITI